MADVCEDLEMTWVTINDVTKVIHVSKSALQKWCAERRYDPRCARKIGKQWFFNLPLIKAEGILLKD